MSSFEPRIVAFLCNWCSFEGADRAGEAKLASPANVLPVRVMCSGRVDHELVLETLAAGADGVLVLGCHPGDCHYKTGNTKALRRHAFMSAVLNAFGIEEQRVRLDWVSASEGQRFAAVTAEHVETVRALGPLRWS